MPFCPQCRDEYRVGFTTCADCGAALVDALPAPPPPADSDSADEEAWEVVARPEKAYEADLIVMRLREEGIEAQALPQGTFPVPDVESFAAAQVVVPRGRGEAARRILAAPVALPEDAESPDEAGGARERPPEDE
jgi:hypothetical protein